MQQEVPVYWGKAIGRVVRKGTKELGPLVLGMVLQGLTKRQLVDLKPAPSLHSDVVGRESRGQSPCEVKRGDSPLDSLFLAFIVPRSNQRLNIKVIQYILAIGESRKSPL